MAVRSAPKLPSHVTYSAWADVYLMLCLDVTCNSDAAHANYLEFYLEALVTSTGPLNERAALACGYCPFAISSQANPLRN